MLWILIFITALSLGVYGFWRTRGPGRLRYGQPQLYVELPEGPPLRKSVEGDLAFIRELSLPETSEGLKPRKPAERNLASAEISAPQEMAHAAAPQASAPASHGGATMDAPSQNGYGDPTLQLLPGRLEILAGMPGDSIRFIKQPGAVQRITLGRTQGEPGAHVQIPSPTVSRLHVRMNFEGGGWTIENLSATNPVSINGRPATGQGAQMVLSEGDRIEMGEVAFCFRKR